MQTSLFPILIICCLDFYYFVANISFMILELCQKLAKFWNLQYPLKISCTVNKTEFVKIIFLCLGCYLQVNTSPFHLIPFGQKALVHLDTFDNSSLQLAWKGKKQGCSASHRIKPNRNFVNGNSMHPMEAGSQQKPQREKRAETVVINNHQAKKFCKKAGYIPCHTQNKHLQLSSNRTTLPWELCFPFFPEIKRRERRKIKQQKKRMHVLQLPSKVSLHKQKNWLDSFHKTSV